jgi:hypothetical protein
VPSRAERRRAARLARRRGRAWSTISGWIKTGCADRCSMCRVLFLDGDITVGGVTADGRVQYACTKCARELEVIDGIDVVTWPPRGRA